MGLGVGGNLLPLYVRYRGSVISVAVDFNWLGTIVVPKAPVSIKGANWVLFAASHISVGRSFLHRLCPVGTFRDIFLQAGVRKIHAAVWHILNIGNQAVVPCFIQGGKADP